MAALWVGLGALAAFVALDSTPGQLVIYRLIGGGQQRLCTTCKGV